MILIISGRTDIVAFYSKWFINRLKDGYVDVRNPFYEKKVSRIFFEDVDAYMFCTKNPLPIIPYLNDLNKPIIFHITVTPYKNDIEPNIIDKKLIIEGIKKISNIIGKDNVYVRYDPIFINDKYNLDYHIKAFNKLCTSLNGYIKGIIVSFLDNYKNVQRNYYVLKPKVWTEEDYQKLGSSFSNIAKKNNMTVQTCAENKTLEEYGFIKSACLSANLAKSITGKDFKKWYARGKKACECVEMVDIGAYNTCNHLCKYCYANYDEDKICDNMKKHNVNSTMLIGNLDSDDIVTRRK